jgi:predicted DsbA family dithiol-disulfide isomerase
MILTVDVFSDVICPWCYIGKRRLEKAIATLDTSHSFKVRWLPFQLNPQMPKDGIRRLQYRLRKFGSMERSMELDANVVATGRADSIDFAFDRIERTPNTLDAHRLIWLAERKGVQDAVVEHLFLSYFTKGQNIGDRETLIDVVAEAGLERSLAERVLSSDEGLDAIREAGEQAQQIAIQGVPFFIINGEMMLSGAQPSETFLAAFGHAIASG